MTQEHLIVNIADMKTAKTGSVIITYALGSCIGLTVFDPLAGIGALLHYMLPDSALDLRKAEQNPFMFADSGIERTINALQRMGCDLKRLVLKAAGGSNIMDPNGTFNIGKKNYLALKKTLWRYNLLLKGEDIGGAVSRNLMLNIGTGEVFVRYSGIKEERKL